MEISPYISAPSGRRPDWVVIGTDLFCGGTGLWPVNPGLQESNKSVYGNVHRNIVSTVNLGCRLDLKNIAMSARNAEYNPKVNFLHATSIFAYETFSGVRIWYIVFVIKRELNVDS